MGAIFSRYFSRITASIKIHPLFNQYTHLDYLIHQDGIELNIGQLAMNSRLNTLKNRMISFSSTQMKYEKLVIFG